MKSCPKMLMVLCLLATLAACKQAQLGGPVVDAEIHIDLLNQPGASYQFARSTNSVAAIELFGAFEWFALTDLQRSLWLGNFEVDGQLIDPASLYLVTARGGNDVDVNHDGKEDREYTAVRGEWHAIMRGSDLLAAGRRVTALTEASYQRVRDQIGYISDAQLVALLDNFASLVVADVDGNKTVDHSDVLLWSPVYSAARYLGNRGLLDMLTAAITGAAPDNALRAAAESVLRNRLVEPAPPAPDAGTVLGGRISGDTTWTRAGSPYVINGRLFIEGDLAIEPGVTVSGGQIDLYGDLFVTGLPRQPVLLEQLVLIVNSWGSGVSGVVRNVHAASVILDFRVQQLLLEDNVVETAELRLANGVRSATSAVTVRRNVLAGTTVRFDNNLPPMPGFRIDFRNNSIAPAPARRSTLESRWEGPVSRLVIQDNSFNANMRVLRSGAATMDLRLNYWGPAGFPLAMMEEVIPDNAGPLGAPIIPYAPILPVADPATPVLR